MSALKNEPIAVIGMGCRFPGQADSPQAFWDMLCAGRDGIVEVPKERWSIKKFYDSNPNKAGKTYVKYAGFLQQDVREMDALFFGISPREAETLDPQQRIILEVAWEALEDSGLIASRLSGSKTGVFIGGFMMDHMSSLTSYFNRDNINSHSAVSFSQTLLSARLSYTFDLRGPCLTMDTACSSSLVALHQACQAMWRGECNLALVGGVNIMTRAETMITMCKGQFLAADGRSKSFDSRADGYGRGEGAGIVVLKPLSQAQQDGDYIYSVVCATGINQDGRTDGITVPNAEAQAALAKEVIQRAQILPEQLSYVEAHGTGTALGDPAECGALGTLLGNDQGRSHWIGSVKANIGHLESAAGIAGLIKSSLCLEHQQIPPVARLQIPNPNILLDKWGLRLPRQVEAMPEQAGNSYVGINSFGYGGTNAFALLRNAPKAQAQQPIPEQAYYFLPLSARSETALQSVAGRYAQFLAQSEHSLSQICYSAATRREHHRFRLGLAAASKQELIEQAQLFADGKGMHLPNGKAAIEPLKTVFVMTGMGPQWWAMGQELLAKEPVFKAMAERCDVIFQGIAGWSILAEMTKSEAESRITETQFAQPANFVLQVSLFELWLSKGVKPTAIVGHSVGEVSAAYVSGALSLEDALKVSYERSRLQKTKAGRGKMLAVGLSQADAALVLKQFDEQKVSFGAVNSPSAVTLSGEAEVLDAIAQHLTEQNIFNRFLQVELAYHSPIMAELLDEVLNNLKDIQPQQPKIPLYSTVTGQRVYDAVHDAQYWYQNMRQAVLFADAIAELVNAGQSLFLEVGPHPVLGNSIKEVMAMAKKRGSIVATLKRKAPEQVTFYQALSELYCLGCEPNWSAQYPNGGQYVHLPLYPWRRERYWFEREDALLDRLGNEHNHPLLGQKQDSPIPVWHQALNEQFLPWLADHQIQNLVILPGAGYVELGLELHEQHYESEVVSLEHLTFQRALVVSPLDEPVLHTQYDPQLRNFLIYSRSRDGRNWGLHAQGSLTSLDNLKTRTIDLFHMRQQCREVLDVNALYARLAKRGLQYGPCFRGVKQAWRSANRQILVNIQIDQDLSDYKVHPSILDSAFHSLIGMLDADDDTSFLPVSIGRVDLLSSPGLDSWAYGELKVLNEQQMLADLYICDAQGQVQVAVTDLCCQALANVRREERNIHEWLYQVEWQVRELESIASNPAAQWLVFVDQDRQVLPVFADAQRNPVARLVKVYPGPAFKQFSESHFEIRANSLDDFKQLLQAIGQANSWQVLFAWALDCNVEQDCDGFGATVSGMLCAQACVESAQDYRLYFLTQSAQSLAQQDIQVAQASLIGMGRVIGNEFPQLKSTLVDVECCQSHIDLLINELNAQSDEQEVALYQGQRWVYRLNRWQAEQKPFEELNLTGEDAVALVIEDQQTVWHQTERSPIAQDELELHLQQVILPQGYRAGSEQWLPVSALVVQSNAAGFSKDQEVIGFVKLAQLASYVRVAVDNTCLIGAKKSSVLARFNKGKARQAQNNQINHLAVLDQFAKAQYMLEQVLRVQAGERVLIHASDDDSDLAAVQIALANNAQVVATYQSAQKLLVLQALGLKPEACFECSHLQFLQAIEEQYPDGFDCMLNTLSGESAEKALNLVKPFGRVLQVIEDAGQMNAVPANIHLIRLNVNNIKQEQTSVYQAVMQKVLDSFAKNQYRVDRLEIMAASQVEEALRIAQEHTIALSIGTCESIPAIVVEHETLQLAEGTYLITGGFGGFGLKLAEWLAKKGAKHLVLVGRRGAVTEQAKQTVALLKSNGVQVSDAALDIADYNQVKELIAQIDRELPPLVGVFHTAGVLDDAMIPNLTAERVATVMQPKSQGAWNLHQATLGKDLAYFVLFSSISSLVGNPGQANYVAANAYLDELAHYRQAQGLSAQSLNWGVLAEVGMAAANAGVEELLERLGLGSFTPDEAMQMLEQALLSGKAQLGLMRVDWKKLLQANMSATAATRYEPLIDASWLLGDEQLQQLFDELKQKDAEQRLAHIEGIITSIIASVMRLPIESIDTATSLNNFGLDSLVGVELVTTIEKQTSVNLSALEIMQENSVEQLAIKVLDRINIPDDVKTNENV